MATPSVSDFERKGLVSVWYSTVPYTQIPDSYFVEDENGLCEWAHNYKINDYIHDNLETNGADEGTVAIEKAVGECSYSCSYIKPVIEQINRSGHTEITWVILLFDFEYLPEKTQVKQDSYVHYSGAYPYDMGAGSLYEAD